ncbi:E3 ubiquitin-protein ligase MYLIP isoform X2 [Rhagoletis pomonella]|uniref:E3 ubiquitin-protein ligase MYLIP isoform X2 n=1 Tax=Rhagoletis pomonella TaxID=28610 RepID=UPI001781A789|nr:E3 ubiquitin-protein ligase MYLIP isoform X2 [Rhagoletis pomonella]
MWCIVNLPNGTQLAVKWDTKAIGQECLEKVCKALDIVCEMEYFGLEYWTPNQEESRTRQWINLRNRLSCDNSSSSIHLMLALRVKFWVPVHCLLQESVRNIFYMQARSDLLEKRLRAHDWNNAAKLAALLCQADGIRFNPLSLKAKCPTQARRGSGGDVTAQQQHSHKERKDKEHVLSFKKRRLSKQKSTEHIENLHLPAVVADEGSTALSVTMKCSGNAHATSQLATTTTTSASGSDVTEDDTVSTSPLCIYQSYIVQPVCADDGVDADMPEDFYHRIAVEHGKLATLKMTSKSAKYWLLKQIQDLEGYGEEVFSGVTTHESSVRCDVAVGANAITTCVGDEKNVIPFSAIASAKSFRRTFKLEYVGDCNDRRELEIKLPKHAIAAGLYRSITERHAFYVCDKVRGVVTNQFTRDLKGTIASMFKEDTELGKRYVFDIQRTCREVHDQARRILHEKGIEALNNSAVGGNGDLYDSLLGGVAQTHSTSSPSPQQLAGEAPHFDDICVVSDKLDLALREKEKRDAAIARCVEARVSEAMTCKICMDREINTMFNPCSHITTCAECAARCIHCPNCRVKVTSTTRVFLPPELRISATTAPASVTISCVAAH